AVARLQGISGREATQCVPVPFQTNGRHALEVLGDGADGPEVAAMFSVDVGPVSPAMAPLAVGGPEPTSPAEARARLLARVNALRTAAGGGGAQGDARRLGGGPASPGRRAPAGSLARRA